MKLSERYLLRKVFDQYALIPVGQAVMDKNKIIRLNETGYIIASALLEDTDYDSLVEGLKRDYGASEEIINTFLTGMSRYNVIDI